MGQLLPPSHPLAVQSTAPAPSTGPTPVHKWSTDDVPQAQRLDYWIGAICEGFLEMAATSPAAANFHGSLESVPLGGINVNRVVSSAQDVYRTRQGIARSSENYFYLLCKTDSAWATVQDGRTARLLPGDVLLVDSRRCYEFHFPESATTVSLELPTAWVESWLPDPTRHVASRIDATTGWGQTLSSFARQMTPELAAAAPLPAQLLTDQLGVLLALATGSEVPGEKASERAGAALRKRVVDAIRELHAEPGLTAAAVAAELGISERTLHRCLSQGGITFARCLADCRMAVARRLLGERRFDALSVAKVGRRVGLADASHFIRQCRQHLGATPGELRRRR